VNDEARPATTTGRASNCEATDQSNFNPENKRSAASKQEWCAECDREEAQHRAKQEPLHIRAAREWRAWRCRRSREACANSVTYATIAEQAEDLADIAIALRDAANQFAPKYVRWRARQASGTVREILLNIADLQRGSSRNGGTTP
jgi:hypothetical protein